MYLQLVKDVIPRIPEKYTELVINLCALRESANFLGRSNDP